MSLITKYRPKKFDEVVGQPAAVKAMQAAIENGTAQSFMLTGPSGVGKTTLARIGATFGGCTRTDITEIDAATHTGIDDMREINAMMQYRPLAGEYKAVIVDEFHALSKQAVTSLLKALEEPPSFAYWFICTTEPAKIPATIKTRCMPLNLKPVGSDKIEKLLIDVAAKHKLKAKSQVIKLCAEAADGSPRQALAYLAAAHSAKSIEEAQALMANAEESKEAIDLARALMKTSNWRDLKPLLKALNGQNPESVRIVVSRYHTAVVINAGGPVEQRSLEVMTQFERPYERQEGLTPIVLACARLAGKKLGM
jgi:DNA polymerase-3 subunit gamma/tau